MFAIMSQTVYYSSPSVSCKSLLRKLAIIENIQGVPKNLLESGEQYIVASGFSSVFFRVSDKRRNKCSKDSFIQILQLS